MMKLTALRAMEIQVYRERHQNHQSWTLKSSEIEIPFLMIIERYVKGHGKINTV